jgi:hypothetical protein
MLIYTGVSVITSTDYTEAVLNSVKNMLIVIIVLQAVDLMLDGRRICDRIPGAAMVSALLVYIFLLVAIMLVMATGEKMIKSNVTDVVILLNFTKNLMVVVVALVAESVMVRAAIACDVVMTLVMLFIALAFGLIAVVGSLSIIDQLRFR